MARELTNAAMHIIDAKVKLQLFEMTNDLLYGRHSRRDPWGVLVFECVRTGHIEGRPMTTANIAHMLRTTRTLVEHRIAGLLRLGRVRECDGDCLQPGTRRAWAINEDWGNSPEVEKVTVASAEKVFRAGGALQAAHNAEAGGFVRNGHEAAQIAAERFDTGKIVSVKPGTAL